MWQCRIKAKESADMDQAQQPKEGWGITPRATVSEHLWEHWKQYGETPPDETAISEALDQTSCHINNEKNWLDAARTLLNL